MELLLDELLELVLRLDFVLLDFEDLLLTLETLETLEIELEDWLLTLEPELLEYVDRDILDE